MKEMSQGTWARVSRRQTVQGHFAMEKKVQGQNRRNTEDKMCHMHKVGSYMMHIFTERNQDADKMANM